MHDLIIYPYEKQNEYIYQERDNLINEDHIKYDENDEVNRNGISYKINIYDNNHPIDNNNNNNDGDNNDGDNNNDGGNNNDNNNNNDKDNIASQCIHTCIKENIIDDKNYDSFQKREDITNIKKNSLDFNTINEKIFNINIKMKEPKVKTTNDTHVDYNDDNNDDNNISIRTYPKHSTSHHNYTSDDSSYSSIDDIKHILKKSKIKNLQQNKKKYICNYISQHKKRIKEKKSNLIQKKKINKQDNYLNTNFLKINQKTKENIKRASAASIILENNFNSDHIDEDEENSSYDENINYHTNDF